MLDKDKVEELEVGTMTQKMEVAIFEPLEVEDDDDDDRVVLEEWASVAKIHRARTQDRSHAPKCFIIVRWPLPAGRRFESSYH